jgi:hypothetical protein
VSDQESEPAAAASVAEDAPAKLEEELKKFDSQATQTAGDVIKVANEGKSGVEKLEDRHEHVQITASLSEVSIVSITI